MKKLAGTLFVSGYALDWHVVNNVPRYRSLRHQNLPPYPWDYSKPLPWHEPRASVDIRKRKHMRHELLGTRIAAGNGIDWSWRNLVRLSEMPWLKDHKLAEQVVLPGSAYIALAIEALSQIRDFKDELVAGQAMSFECRNINISAPFLPPDDNDAEAEHTELHTTMCQRKISTAKSSADWYEFAISSWASGATTLHCTGSIRVVPSAMDSDEGVSIMGQGYEAWGMKCWYDKSREEGLNFGPHFQSLTSLHTDGNRSCADAIATTLLDPPSAAAAGMYYGVHPITLDACFQAAIMGGTAGNLSTLRAYVPVFIAECRVDIPAGGAASLGSDECRVHSRIEKTGPSTRNVNCTLRTPDGRPAIDIKNLRMSLYAGKAPTAPDSSMFAQRQPCLRILWKPDILRMGTDSLGALTEYISAFSEEQSDDMKDNETLLVFAALLDLAGFKKPRMRVLEFGRANQWTAKQCLEMLGKDSAFPRCRSWSDGGIGNDGKLVVDEAEISEPFDVVLVPHVSSSTTFGLPIPKC